MIKVEDQGLLQEVAHLIRKYYDGHGKNLEKFATDIINLIKTPSVTSTTCLSRVLKIDELSEGEEYLVIELPDPLNFNTVIKWDVFELEAKRPSFPNPLMFSTQIKTNWEFEFAKINDFGQAIYEKKLTLDNSILSSFIEIYRIST
jgi:hypothetical protein